MQCVCVESDDILPSELTEGAELYNEELSPTVMLSTKYNI